MREIITTLGPGNTLLIVICWIIGLCCIPVMKKIQPESYKAYAVYVVAVLLIFTFFVVQHICL